MRICSLVRNLFHVLFALIVGFSAVSLAQPTRVEAATQAQIDTALASGVAWLVAQQQGDGSWTGGYAADTGFAVATLAHYAEQLGKTPLDPTYIYSTNVQNGLNYLFSSATRDNVGHDWVYWNVGGNNSYQTGPCLMAIARSGAPTAIIPSGPLAGMTYKQVAQAAVDWLASAQITTGNGTGAWYYTKGSTIGDQSATGWVTMGLGYATHSMGCTLPTDLLTRLSTWNSFIQSTTPGPNFGGAAYTSTYLDWYNVYKNGHLLFAQKLCGDTLTTPRVQDGLTFLDTHWNDPTNGSGSSNDYGWRGNPPTIPPSYIATVAATKGFTEMGIVTFSGHNWYNDFADVIVTEQEPDGHWLGGGHGETNNRSTCWALMTLLKVMSHIPPTVTTNAATSITTDAAILNMAYTLGTYSPVQIRFAYRKSADAAWTDNTTWVPKLADGTYAKSLTGLDTGTQYDFKAQLKYDSTEIEGDTLQFTTGTPPPPPPPPPPAGITGDAAEGASSGESHSTTIRTANLRIAMLNVPGQVSVNQPITISANVVNDGTETGSTRVALKINGQIEQTKMVTVGGGSSRQVKFTVTRTEPGSYTVIMGFSQRASFLVTKDSSSSTSVDGGVIVMILLGFLVLAAVIVVMLSFRRRPSC